MKISKILLTLGFLLFNTVLHAYDFTVNGLYYNVISEEERTCEVVNDGQKDSLTNEPLGACYSGKIVIPKTVRWENKEYRVVSIGRMAFTHTKVISVVIPEGVVNIEKMAFFAAQHLQSVNIPFSVTNIGGWAFMGTVCSSLIIPPSVTKIGDHAFSPCDYLKSITILSKQPCSLGESVFPGQPTLIHVPSGSRQKYINDPAWKELNIVDDINLQ